MRMPGNMPHHEFVESRRSTRKFPNIEGVTTHAQLRALERLGIRLPRKTWEAIVKGIFDGLWAWRPSSENRAYDVPVEAAGSLFMLPVVVAFNHGPRPSAGVTSTYACKSRILESWV